MGQTIFMYNVQDFILSIPDLLMPLEETDQDEQEPIAEPAPTEEPDLTSHEIITEEEYELIETGYVVELVDSEDEGEEQAN